MSITKILTNDDLSPDQKLKAVGAIVKDVRETYGNEEISVPSPDVNTTSGMMSFVHLEDEAKVALLRNEVQSIKVRAIEYSKNNEGTVLNRKLEELISTNGMMCNVSAGTQFDYI